MGWGEWYFHISWSLPNGATKGNNFFYQHAPTWADPCSAAGRTCGEGSVNPSVNQFHSVPAKLVMSLALGALVQRKRPGPSQIWPQHCNPALSTNIYQKASKLSESKLSPRCTERNAKVSPNFCRHSTSPIIGSGFAATNLIYRLLFQIQQYFQHNYSSTRLSVQVLEDL